MELFGYDLSDYGGVPPDIAACGWELLDDRLAEVVSRFRERFGLASAGVRSEGPRAGG